MDGLSDLLANATAGIAFNFTVTAQDAFNNAVTTYSGTAHFTSTDGAAVLPADTTLTSGAGMFSATLKTSGTRTIAAVDTVSGSINGTTGNIVVSPAAATHGYAVAFLTSACVFAVGGVLAAAFFPSKQKLAEMRDAATAVSSEAPKQSASELQASDA